MAVPILDKSQRKYPLAQPDGWVPKMARYTLRLPSEINQLAIAYIGIQARHGHIVPESAINAIDKWTSISASASASTGDGSNAPAITDRLSVLFGRDEPQARIYACYWPSRQQAQTSLAALKLKDIFRNLPEDAQKYTGLWVEWIVPDLTRFETNYSGDDYRPGLAQYPGTRQESHDLTGYWGAARDRIRASAYDRLDTSSDGEDGVESANRNGGGIDAGSLTSPAPSSSSSVLDFQKDTLGKYIRGNNVATLAHIRSGQYWEACPEDESNAYEEKLEPHLLNGLKDVLSHPAEKGDYGLRFVRNIPPAPQPHVRKETCALGYFRSLKDLENWAKDCPSHHKIFGGALSHRKRFGDGYKMRTWHEICVLKPGEANWEYVNCGPETGILPFVNSQTVEML